MDAYNEQLGKILCEVERIYGIARTAQNLQENITAVIGRVDSELVGLEASEVTRRNFEVGKQMVLLSYLVFRMSYFESIRLNFNQFPALQEIAKVLMLYRDRKNFNRCVVQVNKVIKLLSEMDKMSAKLRLDMTYRYLRVFVVLIMYRNSCNSSIVAELLLSQMMLQSKKEEG